MEEIAPIEVYEDMPEAVVEEENQAAAQSAPERDYILDLIEKTDVTKMGLKTTVVCVTLKNGFEIVTSASCVDPANYNQEIGFDIAFSRAKEKIAEMDGYLKQENWFIDNMLPPPDVRDCDFMEEVFSHAE